MKIPIILICCFVFQNYLIAQISITSIYKKNYSIHYQKPIRKIMVYGPKNILSSYYKGYGYPVNKILIMSTKNRAEAFTLLEEMRYTFPDQPTELTYRQPFYKVIYGFFKIREDAKKELKKLNRYFLNQRPLVIFTTKEPVQLVDSIFAKNKEFLRRDRRW